MFHKTAERVLGVPTARFHQVGLFQGFRPFDARVFDSLFDPAHLEYRQRAAAESDPAFKQLIPYIVLRYGGQLFHYIRGQSGTETRLQAQRSIGIGGHISADDDATAADPYRAGMLRELAEEVKLRSGYRETIFGLINDDSTPVGAVHLGVVHLFDLDGPDVRPREDAIHQAGFASIAELLTGIDQFETWSQFVLTELARTMQ